MPLPTPHQYTAVCFSVHRAPVLPQYKIARIASLFTKSSASAYRSRLRRVRIESKSKTDVDFSEFALWRLAVITFPQPVSATIDELEYERHPIRRGQISGWALEKLQSKSPGYSYASGMKEDHRSLERLVVKPLVEAGIITSPNQLWVARQCICPCAKFVEALGRCPDILSFHADLLCLEMLVNE